MILPEGPALAVLLAAIALAALALLVQTWRVGRLKRKLAEATGARQAQASTYGRITEQWAPFLKGYPYDPQNFRFLGAPIDGVQFEDDRVVFVEIKTNRSTLSPRQERIRALVQARKVEWYEFRVEEAARPSFFKRG